MLHKKNRLVKADDIQQVFTRGRSFFNPFFTIKFLNGGTQKLFTVVVSTKVFKKAVARNRLKRLIREELRKNLGSFKTGSYLIIAKPKLKSLQETEVLKSFSELWKKIR